LKNWQKVLVTEDETILKVIAVVDRYLTQLALVVDDANHLIGTVTDGDIRRGILREVPLDAPIKEVMNRSPLVLRHGENPTDVYAKMKIESIRSVPVLNQDGSIFDVLTPDEISVPESKNNFVILMAGGLGLRLRPLTENTPKPMLPIGSKPVLESIVDRLSDQGFRKIFLAVNYLAEKIESHFEYGQEHNVEIQYLREKDKMGTAGALALLPESPQDPVLVMNGDIVTKVNYNAILAFHHEHNAMATVCVREHHYQVPYGVVNIDTAKVTGIVEKPVERYLINAGIYVLNPKVLEMIKPLGAIDMTDLLEILIEQNHVVAAFPIREYWADIGQFEDLQKANDHHAREEGKS
jgi:dTDP-glucose pyrophosphorylase